MEKDRKKLAMLSFFAIFIMISIVLIVTFTIAIPFVLDFLYHSYTASQDIFSYGESEISQIENESIRQNIQAGHNQSLETTYEQISILQNFYKYSWLLIIIIVSLVTFVFARRMVEFERRGGVV